jgi:DNA-binding transcriptional LysR family regulator
MNIRQLEAFRAVATSGSTTAAARVLDMSQPAVSRLLAQFEEDLGVELFSRHKNRLIVTPQALRLLDGVERTIEEMRRIERLASEIRHGVRDVLIRLAVPPTVAERVMPVVLKAFLAAWPDAVVEILPGGYEKMERQVGEGRADVALLMLPTRFPGLRVGPTLSASSVCVMPAGHPLARLAVVAPADLAGVPLILLGRERSSRLEIERLFRWHGVTPEVRIETHTVGCACAHVAGGLGVTIVNRLMANASTPSGVETRPFQPGLTTQYAVVQPPAPAANPVADALAQHLHRVLAGLLADQHPPS